MGAYPVLIAAGAAYIDQATKLRHRWIRTALPAMMILVGVFTMPVALPVLPPEVESRYIKKLVGMVPGLDGALRWEDGRYYDLPQDYADMLGWQEIADMVGQAWQKIPDKSIGAIFADNYGLAGAIEHFGKKYDVPQVISFSDNYRYWLPDSLPPNFKTLLYVNHELGEDMPGFFETLEKVGELDMPLSRQHGVVVYLCNNPTPAFFERINTAIKKARAEEEID